MPTLHLPTSSRRPHAALPARALSTHALAVRALLGLALPALALLVAAPLLAAQSAAVAAPLAAPTTNAAHAAHATDAAAQGARFAPGELERRLQRIGQRMESARADGHIPGLALGIVVDDRAVLLQGFGLADVEAGRAVAPDTLFAVGSTTKAFTATLCAMLADEGKLSWDDPITRFVPEFALKPEPGADAPYGKQPVVSVRDVLSHRTGFSRNDILWAGNSVPRETILLTAARAEPWAPYRTQFLYNNVQVMSAGVAAGRLQGGDWEGLLRERLLQPLHMANTNTSVTQCADDPRLSKGYQWEAESSTWRHLPMRNLDAIAPAGAINSSVTDMAQWLRLLLGGGAIDGERLVTVESLEETWSPQIALGGGDSYGLCWFLHEWQGHRVVEHGGNIDGFAAEVALLPDDGIGFVLLTNVSATALQSTSRGIVFGGLLDDEPDPSALAGGDATFAEYLGAYTCNSPGYRDEDFHVVVRDGRLAIDVPRQTVYVLRAPDAEGRWPFELTDTISIDFQRGAAGTVTALTMYQGGLTLEMPKVGVEQHPDEPLEPLARLLGDYADGTQAIAVVIHNQRLALDVPGQMTYELRPADADGRRAFRALDGFSAQFEERDGEVVALVNHQPDGTYRYERQRAATATATADATGSSDALPDLAALIALRGASADVAAWNALGDWRLTGGVRFVNSGLPGALTSSFRGQTRFHEETDFGPYGIALQASDDAHAWTESIFSPWRELAGTMLRQALQTPANLLGDWRVRFGDIRVLRRDVQGGRTALVVALHDGDLPPVTVYVAADDGDILRVDSEELTPGGQRVPQTITFGDWRDVGPAGGRAVRVPFHSETRSENLGLIEVQYEMAETGLSLPDDLFRLKPPANTAPSAAHEADSGH